MPELTMEEWRFISVLLANEISHEGALGLNVLAERHRATWEKIQPACEWEDE
jgi:hypothetical protein